MKNMRSHLGLLGGIQLPRLVLDMATDCNLAYIVKNTCHAYNRRKSSVIRL